MGKNVLGLPHFTITTYNGSGDRLFNYISIFTITVFAFIIMLAWQLLRKKQETNRTIQYWLSAYIRYYFALTMIKYGLEKVIQMQFPFPYTSLVQTYGQSSPMRLMWSFIGYSGPYSMTLGIIEMISGFLVLFRRTVLLGALLSVAILSNVAVLNFCYDVPVKLFALNFLLMAVYVAAPNAKRLLAFFFMNKTVAVRRTERPQYSPKTWRLILIAKYSLAVVVLLFSLQYVRLKYSTWGNGAFPQTPLFGIYEVTAFVRNGDTLPPLQTDTTRWKEISIIYRKEAMIKLMNDSIRNYRLVTDTASQTIEMGRKEDKSKAALFSYTKPVLSELKLKGQWQGDSLTILLQKQDMNRYLLINRGFHWINEYPYR